MAVKLNWSMIRGDSDSRTVRVTSGNPLTTGDKVAMQVRPSYDGEVLVSKEVTDFPNGDAVIKILPEDTAELTPGRYYYDVQLTRAGGSVLTIIEKSRFELREDITHG